MKQANYDDLRAIVTRPGVTRRSFSSPGTTLAWTSLEPGHTPRPHSHPHEQVVVVEQNRDGQLRSLIALETGIARERMISVLDYGGLPLTADYVVQSVSEHLAGVAV